ncbi:MAG: hypothetical protein HFE90_06645 [Firmicutes bacterium]|nr:hypothetical protein [Bacillota bacterium]
MFLLERRFNSMQLVAVSISAILEASVVSVTACIAAAAPLHRISRKNIVDSIETVE